jgi:hypothetical protein
MQLPGKRVAVQVAMVRQVAAEVSLVVPAALALPALALQQFSLLRAVAAEARPQPQLASSLAWALLPRRAEARVAAQARPE